MTGDPASLRGLDAHHTLVLIDRKRHHRAALMQLGGFGSHGPDTGSIPSIALESVEVLRDGAAAQYGSDAIAGVINFNLRRNDSGFDLRTRYGGYTGGDGEELTLEANAGFPLGGGFINFGGQYSDSNPTSRSEPYNLAIGESGLTPLQAALNFNQTRLSERGRFVDAEAEHDIRYGAPAARAVLSLRHTRQRLDLLLRGRYYGEYKNANTAELTEIQKFSRKFMLDAEAAWSFGGRYSLKLGGRNLFDVHPDRGRFEACGGRIYRSDSVVPWQGTLLYLQLAPPCATFGLWLSVAVTVIIDHKPDQPAVQELPHDPRSCRPAAAENPSLHRWSMGRCRQLRQLAGAQPGDRRIDCRSRQGERGGNPPCDRGG